MLIVAFFVVGIAVVGGARVVVSSDVFVGIIVVGFFVVGIVVVGGACVVILCKRYVKIHVAF